MKLNRPFARIVLMMTAAAFANASVNGAAQPLDSDSVNLAGRAFFEAYTHQDGAVRQAARLYLLGVQDATEGRVWCSYKLLKTVTLQEAIYEHFRKLPAQRLDERAANLIQEMLAKSYPCEVSP